MDVGYAIVLSLSLESDDRDFCQKIDYYCEIVCDDSLGSNRTGIRTYMRILYRVVKRVFINYSLSSPH